MLYRSIAGALLLVSGAAFAVPIVDVPSLPPADRAAVSALEQAFFDRVAKDGVEAAAIWQFTQVGATDQVTDELRQQFKKQDQNCGTVTSVERYRTESLGSRAVHDYFLVIQGSCVVRWKLSYARPGPKWTFRGFDYQSSDGANWDY